MTDSTIFEGTTTPSTDATHKTPEEQNLFTALVGETQKYKTPEALAKAYTEADAFIAQLKEENRKLREQAAAAKTIDEVLERINSTNKEPEEPPPTVSAIKPEDVQSLVEQTLEQREQQRIRQTNLLQADKAMKEKFGDKAAEMFASVASTPALKSTLMELAAVDPSKFLAVFAASPVVTGGGVDTGSVVTPVLPNGGNRASVEGTKEWATKIRKEDPTLYWSSEFQTKLQRMVTANPSLYFGN